MEALALRVSGLDPYVDGAIRVVAFYDTLMRRRVDLPALARASAGLAECVTGIRLHGTGRAIRVSPLGTEATAPPRPASTTAPVVLDEEEIGEVWLERPGPPHQLDEVLLDRLAIAVAAAVERYGPARTTMADPALVELAVAAGTDEVARARALRLLGFAAGAPLHVVAVRSGAVPLDRVGAAVCPHGLVKAAALAAPCEDVGVLLATAVDRGAFPEGVRAGVAGPGTAEAVRAGGAAAGLSDGVRVGQDGRGYVGWTGGAGVGPARLPDGPRAEPTTGPAGPDTSWRHARTALRFTTDREPVVHYAELGALALLAEVPDAVARANPDVAALARIADSRPEDLATLDAYCATASVRRAADRLHLHHSTVSRRVDQLSRTLGVDLTDPTGLTRMRLALTVWRLLDG
ncbi:helix-turn-helix domain-containing protein [Streptomyces sp. NPDC048623]|uniref:helix-turn-helix domain-containing protein n=1 Tax=Streptomyces sp. NPDC048623 TaxID=3155761 RepID=UPI0034311056